MKNKILRICFASISLVLIVSMLGLLVACGDEVPVNGEQEEEEEEEEEEPEVITLVFASMAMNPEAPLSLALDKFMGYVEERAEGRIEFEVYPGDTLLGIFEAYRGVEGGVADICYYTVGTDPGLLPLNEFTRLPFLGWDSPAMATEIYAEALKTVPALDEEWGIIMPYAVSMMAPVQLHTTGEEVMLPEDIEGMKIIASSEMGIMVNLAGGSAINLTPLDYYTSLERGMAAGLLDHFPVVEMSGCLPLLTSHTVFGDAGICMVPQMLIFNRDTWNSLPADIQQIFIEVEPLVREDLWQALSIDNEAAMSNAEALDHTFIYLTSEEIEIWAEALKQVEEEWLELNPDLGPGVLEAVKSLIAEYAAE